MSESDIRSRRTRPSSVASRVVPRACPAHAAEVLVGTGRGWQQKSRSCDDNFSPSGTVWPLLPIVPLRHVFGRPRPARDELERSKLAASICSARTYIPPDRPAVRRARGANRSRTAPIRWSPNDPDSRVCAAQTRVGMHVCRSLLGSDSAKRVTRLLYGYESTLPIHVFACSRRRSMYSLWRFVHSARWPLTHA